MAATSSSASIQLHPGKGLTSYFHFPDNRNVVVYKHTAVGLKFCLDMPAEQAEQVLTLAFRDASTYIEADSCEGAIDRSIPAGNLFKQMVESHNLTLQDALREMVELAEEKRPRSAAPIESPEGLASILAKLAPNETPEQLAERLKGLLEASLPEAIEHLKRCEDKNGREKTTGYIYLRKQKDLEGAA